MSQTYGLAKSPKDTTMSWLTPQHDVPTIGHYFRTAGYDTFYIGKWHISYQDLLQQNNNGDDDYVVVEDPEEYRRANVLN